MTRVIHTGDTHLGYRQYHSPERQRDFFRAFERVVTDAVEDDVDAVVHAGDLFHDRRPGLRDLQGTVAALRDLADAGIPFLAVVGNHEGKRDGQWLDLFEDLGLATRLDDEPHVVGDTAFYGLDFVPRSRRDDLDYEFAAHDTDYAMLVSHGLFEPFAHADWDTERLLAESSVDFDALLLGDNHAPGVEEVDDTWVTYCGSTERASASERDDRGYNIVATEVGTVAISRRGIPDTRAFRFVDVELQAGEGVERVREAVREHDCEDAVVVVTVTGDGEPVSPAPVEELAIDRGALVARVNDRREFDEEQEVDVTFADPDEAVRERVRDLGLSQAARDVDETVRASKVADSNVRDSVKERVESLVDEDDLDAFEGAEPAAGDASDDAGGDPVEDDDNDTTDDPAPAESTDQSSQDEPPESEQASTDGGDTVRAGPDEAPETDATLDEPADEQAAGNDSQASMEEFL
ncbi:DNA double-strand break repair protein Mre11 [Haloarchaeobius sp. FL176]|uniref:DNA double-strand break repair protein Mre11 n=1 Tax=Haloarchaeobius sp. FL176 TaxID=2967129 RepID=UPI002149854C|nr:DNA double-strand break repair protein Mre11 [Haloarchaeobius sp. FL176]